MLNGEVKLSYYNNGSSVYKKIAALVGDAKDYDEDKYDEATGVTKSITPNSITMYWLLAVPVQERRSMR